MSSSPPLAPSSTASEAAAGNTRHSREDTENSDLDPAAFLQSVRELSEKREREDAERFRKLEEEVQKGREARAARRLERARSISPEKRRTAPSSTARAATDSSDVGSSFPTTTPSSVPDSRQSPRDGAEKDGMTSQAGSTDGVPEFKGFSSIKRSSTTSTPKTHRTEDGSDVSATNSTSAASLARSGTLSWQQRRPTSKVGTSSAASNDSRPLSMAVMESKKNPSQLEEQPSRDQIAASLGARDPSWFRQTADRGVGSAAYRKSKDESELDNTTVISGRRVLPGMSHESHTEPGRNERASVSESPSIKSGTNSMTGSVRESTLSSNSTTSTIFDNKPDLKSLIAADEDQQRASPAYGSETTADGQQNSPTRTLSTSNTQARSSATEERPPSPTKGMGGFVQSAMMKRSDSVSKRWSTQPGASLSRHNSTASQRSGLSGLQSSLSMPKLESTADSVDKASNERDTRSTSVSKSDNNLSNLPKESEKDVFVTPALPSHSRTKSVASIRSVNEDNTSGTFSPGSPSKRWSPTKSSWIESALNRPEPSKPTPTKNSQPSWMADLAKANAQRASVDLTPKPAEELSLRPDSPIKTVPFGPSILRRPDSRDQSAGSQPATPITSPKSSFGRLPETTTILAAEKLPSEILSSPESQTIKTVQQEEPASLKSKSTESSAQTPEATTQPSSVEKQDDLSSKPLKKAKPETPPKPATDFRSVLKSRPVTEAKSTAEPEFLSKVGNLRRAQQDRYVAPDVLKDNIQRGKSALSVTGGPMKSERKDEFKESLQSKKDAIRKAKEEGRELPGQMHKKKVVETVQKPSKPEALAKREMPGRSESVRSMPIQDKPATPEALARHRSLKQKPATEKTRAESSFAPTEAPFSPLEKQVSAPAVVETKPSQETSKLAARMNPGLANFLARGPPSASASPSRSSTLDMTTATSSARNVTIEQPVGSEQLQDMRKDRAKGPKRRKGASATTGALGQGESSLQAGLQSSSPSTVTVFPKGSVNDSVEVQSRQEIEADDQPSVQVTTEKPKPKALPGSAAALMMQSLNKRQQVGSRSPVKETPTVPSKPATPVKSPSLTSKISPTFERSSSIVSSITESPAVPDFQGFGSKKTKAAENKENTDEKLPSVKSVTSKWGQKPSPQRSETPTQIQLPTRKDEEAAMISAGLLASNQPESRNGLGTNVEKTTGTASTNLPPKPAKSSRTVSGQLAEASPNKDPPKTSTVGRPETEIRKLLLNLLGSAPTSNGPLAVDTQAILESSSQEQSNEQARTLRKSVQLVFPNETLRSLPQQEENTHFTESVYLCTHVHAPTKGAKATQVFLWVGDSAPASTVESGLAAARKTAKSNGNAALQVIYQGKESGAFLQALGGIFITRRGNHENAPKQYMLCGRKHLGAFVFDEVDFAVESLSAGFVFLVSYPVTIQETKLFLWKGAACSTEETSAARLAAMDLSETGEIVEVDGGAETTKFLQIFGSRTTKTSIPSSSELWKAKVATPNKFCTRLFRIQLAETRPSLISSIWNRRPSWNGARSASHSRSPSRPTSQDVQVDVLHFSLFTQSDLEAEGIYVLDGFSALYVLIGPLIAQQPEHIKNALFAQTLLFASDYAILSASVEDRPCIPQCEVVFEGVPGDMKLLFRHWDPASGLWGTAGLMAGVSNVRSSGRDVVIRPLEDVLREVFQE